MNKKWKIVGIEFSHMHMGDLLGCVDRHPHAEIAGICDADPERMTEARERFGIGDERVFTDYRACLEATRPDMVILCPPTAGHADWVERVAPSGAHVFVEKPFAGSLADADRMIGAVKATGRQLIINWPLRWVASHVTAHRLIREGQIGDLLEVHYYDGNRGPLYHGADKIEKEPTDEDKRSAWWYRKSAGGGSLRDYLGYGVTLGTWFNGGRRPDEITAMASGGEGLEVDEHSITIARYGTHLSKFETRWGTFSDPWVHQPQPKCGFVLRGSEGTISSYDYEPHVRVQTRGRPEGFEIEADSLPPEEADGIAFAISRLESGRPIDGPLSPAVARIGQEMVDAAIRSLEEGRAVKLEGGGS